MDWDTSGRPWSQLGYGHGRGHGRGVSRGISLQSMCGKIQGPDNGRAMTMISLIARVVAMAIQLQVGLGNGQSRFL